MVVSYLKLLFLYLFIFILIFLSSLPLYLPDISNVFPLIDVTIIYYWCLYRPRRMPYWFVFFIGILQDILMGLPPGITAFTNLVLKAILDYQRDRLLGQAFVVIWSFFLLATFFIFFIKWLLFAIVLEHVLAHIGIIAVQLLLTFFIYPLLHKVFRVIDKRVVLDF